MRKALLVVVTFNSYDLLQYLIDSLQEFCADHPGNYAIVVENSGDQRVSDGISTKLTSDRVLVEVSSSNEGFSPSVNLGYKLATNRWGSFDFVVLLNPDVIRAGRTVAELVNRAADPSEANIGISSVVLKDEDGHISRASAQREWNRRRFFCELLGERELASFLHTKPIYFSEMEIITGHEQPAVMTGAVMCVRSEVFGTGLETHLPMYLEDQELSHRCTELGYQLRLHSDLEAVHIGGVSRKSISYHEHALRVMELVESKVQCMARIQGYNVISLRLIVFAGGVSRLIAAPIVAAIRASVRKSSPRQEFAWARDQARLASWFIRWSVKGRFHTTPVSLEQYFEEYAPSRPDVEKTHDRL